MFLGIWNSLWAEKIMNNRRRLRLAQLELEIDDAQNAAVAAAQQQAQQAQQQRRRRRWWTRPWLLRRPAFGFIAESTDDLFFFRSGSGCVASGNSLWSSLWSSLGITQTTIVSTMTLSQEFINHFPHFNSIILIGRHLCWSPRFCQLCSQL